MDTSTLHLFKAVAKMRLTVLSLAVLAPLSHAATTVSTVGYGFKTVTIPANGAQSTNTYVSLPLTNPPVYSAGINTWSSTTLTVAGTPWTAGEFAVTGSPYFVEITSGLQAGRFLLITGNTTNTLTVDITDRTNQSTGLDEAQFSVAQNDKFRIVPGETLASFMGDGSAQNPLLLRGGNSLFSADSVGINHPNLNLEFDYYFNTKTQVWTSTTTFGSQNAVVVSPDTVLNFNRRANAPAVTVTFVGNVPDVAPLTKVTNINVVYGSTRLPVDMTLASLHFSNWTRGTSQFSVDTIGIWNPKGFFQDYYELPDNGTAFGKWVLVGDPTKADQSNVAILGGTGFQINKRASVSGAGSFISQVLPLSN